MNRVVLVIFVLFSLLQLACQKTAADGAAPATNTAAASPAPSVAPPFQYKDLVVGEGRRVLWGQTVKVQYVGKLSDGTVVDEGKFEFKVGDPGYIKGFNVAIGGGEGIEAMRDGGKRLAVLPPEFAYGKEGDGKKVPPNATISFEIEILKVQGGIGF
ncbi:MAG TPA: FKBP-type peptidyl-prolyl cis-trans isomerase [Blastocatellia bacterium]|nr:FKBP-type peptidyl-prolyl cis-trans isomerase [Blastocatellia bacterium]